MVLTLSAESQDTPAYKYFVGTADPDTNWKAVTFDDSVWSQGSGSIGYSDNDDSTLIDTAPSVFIRHSLRFNNDYTNYKGIIIYPDFDDGFIAYLNSVEILRVNIADSIENPTRLQTTNRSHEAFGYRIADGPQLYEMPGYYIDSSQLAACAVDTLNMLAFAVFNDSVNGSDLTFNFHYIIVDSSFSEHHVNLNYIAKPAADSTQLPYIVIETNEFGIYDSSVIASIGIINNSSGQFNRLPDNFTDYNGRIRLKLHGAYSLQFPKKSLRIELQDSTGDNNNVSILGLIDSITTAISPDIDRNYLIWPVVQYTEYGEYVGLTYNDWLDETKAWIEGRLAWIDENIGDLDYDPTCYSSYNDYRFDSNGIEVSCYPNPFIDELNIRLYTAYPGDIKISIYDLAGIELYAESFSVTEDNNLIVMNFDTEIAPGFYTLIITKGNALVHTQKIVKVN